MIAKITGTVEEFLPHSLIVGVGGIGYEVFVTIAEKDLIVVGEKLTFYIAENIKEDEYTLYGFLELEARSMYYQLTSVSGVGPKAGMAILSTHKVDEIASAIMQDNISFFSAVSGIGKKTAQRIILDLKGKLVMTDDEELKTDSQDPAYQALISLGYKPKDAEIALKDIDKTLSTQQRVKLALKGVK
ncbi:Holliday junction branch migration protein RuvA [Candidatus Saccharibacteria bacterium]|nr:Holliday junction branch migration protein RuvA [Candidatus Saccharibacteria bacterium]